MRFLNTFLKFLALIIVFKACFFGGLVFASVQNFGQETTAEQTATSTYWTATSTAQTQMPKSEDTNGRYFFNPTVPADNKMYLLPQGVNFSINGSTTLKLWFLEAETGATNFWLYYKNCSGTNRNTPIGSTGIFITLNGSTYNLRSSNAITDTCIKDMYIGGVPNIGIYFLSFDNSNLGYINTEAEVYEYLDTLNNEFYETNFSSETSDIINIYSPEQATTTSTTTVNFNFLYYAKESDLIDSYQLQINNNVSNTGFSFSGSVENGFNTISRDITLATSSYTAILYLYSSETGLSYGTQNIDFIVINNPLSSILGVNSTDWVDLMNLATSTCSISNLSGCFQNAIAFLFFPSSTSLNRFINLKDEIQNKPPFGYATAYISVLDDLNSSASSSFMLSIEDNISNNIFSPLREGLVKIIWFCFAVWVFNRLRHLDL